MRLRYERIDNENTLDNRHSNTIEIQNTTPILFLWSMYFYLLWSKTLSLSMSWKFCWLSIIVVHSHWARLCWWYVEWSDSRFQVAETVSSISHRRWNVEVILRRLFLLLLILRRWFKLQWLPTNVKVSR